MELSGSILKKFIFWEVATPKIVPNISGNENPEKLLIFLEIEPCTFRLKLEKMKIICPKKILYISRNGTCLLYD